MKYKDGEGICEKCHQPGHGLEFHMADKVQFSSLNFQRKTPFSVNDIGTAFKKHARIPRTISSLYCPRCEILLTSSFAGNSPDGKYCEGCYNDLYGTRTA